MKARISTLAMGVALAFSTPVAAQDNCLWADDATAFAATGDGNLTYSEAVRRAMASQPGRAALAAAPPACSVEAETLRQERVTGTAKIPNGTIFAFGLRVPRLAAAPAERADPQLRANAVAAPSGGGAALDARDEELSRRIAALEAGGGSSTEIAALRADLASLRAERVQAGRPVVRNTTRVVRETRVVNQGLNEADRTVLDSWKDAREGITNSLGRLFGTGPDNPETREREDGIIGGLQATDAEHTRKIGVLENLLSWTYWALWTLLPLLLVGLAVFFLARSGLAKKTDHDDTKADATTVADLTQRVDELDARQTDTEQQVGKKTVALAPDLAATVAGMKEGEELTTTVVVESVAHEVGLRKGAGDDVFIVSGVKGHVASNVVKAYNLTRTLRNAAWSDRLNVKASV